MTPANTNGRRKPVLYIAASSAEPLTVTRIAMALELAGAFTFATQWWLTCGRWTGLDHTVPREEQRIIAAECLEAVASADAIWFLTPQETSYGAWVELGAALERKRLLRTPYLLVTGEGCGRSIFTGCADLRDPCHDVGLFHALKFAREFMAPVELGKAVGA